MAVYNVNQNRQFYVVTKVVTTTPKAEGEIQLLDYKDAEGQIAFLHYGKAGLTRTDLIDVDKICYAKHTTATSMQRKPKKAVVSLSKDVNEGKPILGQDYVLRVQINNFLAPGDACVYIKSSAVHATQAMVADPTKFYDKLAESLTKNFARDTSKLLTFESTTDGVVIKEITDQPWRLGVLSQEPVNFEVTATTVKWNGEDVIWATLDEKTGLIPVVEDTDAKPEEIVKNGKQVADIEYFCQAERGDMFRNMGWPHNIDVKYMIDPSKEYDMLDLHYFYSGNGVQVHKSEKDITFAAEPTAMTALKEAISGFTEVKE